MKKIEYLILNPMGPLKYSAEERKRLEIIKKK